MPSSPSPCDIPGAAREQGGVFTAAQALTEGWTSRQIRRRLTAGRWTYVAGRALALPQPEWTAFQLAAAAQLSIASAVTSHLTAARLHGFPIDAAQVSHVITRTRHTPIPGIAVHRIDLAADEVRPLGSLVLVTTPERTAADCLATLPARDGLRLWAWLSTRKIMDVPQLAALIRSRYNHDGTARLRALLELVKDGAVSVAEHRCHQILRRAGITGWTANSTIRDATGRVIAVADILFERQRLVIEIDGFGAHSSRDAFVTDRRRQNRLTAAGYTVLRFTWDDLQNPADVVRMICDRASV